MRAPALLALALLAACLDRDAAPPPAADAAKSLNVSSSAFEDGSPMPRIHACERHGGQGLSPPIDFANVPSTAQGLALIVVDPDAPSGHFVHWLWWDLPPRHAAVAAGADLQEAGATLGRTSADTIGYVGPCPPSGTHHYHFQVYAQNERLNLARGTSEPDVVSALATRTLAWGELVGTFSNA